MARIDKRKPENINKLQTSGNWANSDEQQKKLSANEALKIAKQQELDKIASGEYELVTVQPKDSFSKPYQTLRKKQK